MGWFAYSNTGTCCCNAGQTGNACTLVSDDFNRPDSPDVGPDWIDPAGAAVVSNAAVISTNGVHVIAANANPHGPYTFIQARVKLSSGSATARLFVGYANSSANLYATLTTTTLTVGQAGGASQSDTVNIVPGTFYTMTLCFNGTSLIGVAQGVEVRKDGLTAAGTQHGFGVGTATVTFDDVIATRVAEACTGCRPSQSTHCTVCDAGAGFYYDVALGVVFTARECVPVGGNDPCANLPSTVRVDTAGGCRWDYLQSICIYPIPGCSSFEFSVIMFLAAGPTGGLVLRVQVQLVPAATGICSDSPTAITKAIYDSAEDAFNGVCAGPYTLTKWFEEELDGDPSGTEPACNVTWPATITVTRV